MAVDVSTLLSQHDEMVLELVCWAGGGGGRDMRCNLVSTEYSLGNHEEKGYGFDVVFYAIFFPFSTLQSHRSSSRAGTRVPRGTRQRIEGPNQALPVPSSSEAEDASRFKRSPRRVAH